MSAYTKQAIKNSFLKLLNERPISRVTVKAIVDGKPQHVYACTRCLRSGKVTRAV